MDERKRRKVEICVVVGQRAAARAVKGFGGRIFNDWVVFS